MINNFILVEVKGEVVLLVLVVVAAAFVEVPLLVDVVAVELVVIELMCWLVSSVCANIFAKYKYMFVEGVPFVTKVIVVLIVIVLVVVVVVVEEV